LPDLEIPCSWSVLPPMRARRQARIGGDRPAIVETAEQRLKPEQRAGLTACSFELHQRCSWRLPPGLGLHLDQRVTLDCDDLGANQVDPLDLATDLRFEPLGQGPPVAGLERLEMGRTILAQGIVGPDDPGAGDRSR
jgi:hypothetical protein